MKCVQAFDNLGQFETYLDEDIPDGLFWEEGALLCVLLNLLEEVAIVHVLHDDAQVVGFVEGLLKTNDMRVLHRGKYADFSECILLFLLGQRPDLDLLERILLTVGQPLHDVDTGIGSLT